MANEFPAGIYDPQSSESQPHQNPDYSDGSANEPVFVGKEDQDLLQMIDDEMDQAKPTVQTWRENADEADRFEAGWQWDPEDLAIIRSEDRPAITFNRIKPTVNVVCGTEIQFRQEARFVARHPDREMARQFSSLSTEAVRWAVDSTDGPDERSLAFRDMVVRGMGWTGGNLEYDEDPNGRFVLDRIDGHEMWWDAAARKQNILDARWVARKRWMRLHDIQRKWPGKADEVGMTALMATDDEDFPNVVEKVSPIEYAPENQTRLPGSPPQGYVPIIQFQWWDHEDYYRVQTPNGIVSMTVKEYLLMQRRLRQTGSPIPIRSVKLQRKVYHEAFVTGSVVLERRKLPVQSGFTFKCMTGFYDPKEKIWFGLVRGMLDPQRWANKWLSQGLHIVNSNAKGGIMAEVDAFVNPRKAEEEWSSPNAVTLMKEGSLSGQRPKVQPKPMPEFPPAIAEMMQYAVQSLRDVSGVNVEMLGASENEEPGITQRQRQTQGMTILAMLFMALTRYRKQEAEMVMSYLRDYVADGRLIRVGGDYNAPAIPLLRDHLATEYDLVVDEAPHNPNVKLETWSVIKDLAPGLMKFGVFPISLMDYMPLPASLTQDIKEEMQQLRQQQQQAQEQGDGEDPRRTQAEIMKLMAEVEKKKAETAHTVEKTQTVDQKQKLDLAEAMVNAFTEIAQNRRAEEITDAQVEQIEKTLRNADTKTRADAVNKLADVVRKMKAAENEGKQAAQGQ